MPEQTQHTGCLNYLHCLGFVLKRPKKRLIKADEAKREAFVAEYGERFKGGPLQNLDIVINRDMAEEPQWPPNAPGNHQGDDPRREDTQFNKCTSRGATEPVFNPYEGILHEAGHALGLWAREFTSHIPLLQSITMTTEETGHPGIQLSVLNEDEQISTGYDEPDCFPHPMEILAIYASHQKEAE